MMMAARFAVGDLVLTSRGDLARVYEVSGWSREFCWISWNLSIERPNKVSLERENSLTWVPEEWV